MGLTICPRSVTQIVAEELEEHQVSRPQVQNALLRPHGGDADMITEGSGLSAEEQNLVCHSPFWADKPPVRKTEM